MDEANKEMGEKSRTAKINGMTKCKSQHEFVDDIINLITDLDEPSKMQPKMVTAQNKHVVAPKTQNKKPANIKPVLQERRGTTKGAMVYGKIDLQNSSK